MKGFLAYVVIFFIVFLIYTTVSDGAANPKHKRIKAAICQVFGERYCNQAIKIAACETGRTFNVWAGYPHNEYWGLFQMGRPERRKYGHGWNVWVQARAAKRYFERSGRDWSPWPTCRWRAI